MNLLNKKTTRIKKIMELFKIKTIASVVLKEWRVEVVIKKW
jgi:hypothetical protein